MAAQRSAVKEKIHAKYKIFFAVHDLDDLLKRV
jgi:hypothetical protein